MSVQQESILNKVINLRAILKPEIQLSTYGTHKIHNFYPAKFIPQVPRFVINLFQLKNKIILDPFAGSGTTAVESLITGNSVVSNDINPLTEFLINVKTLKFEGKNYHYYLEKLERYLISIKSRNGQFTPNWKNIDYWYEQDFLNELTKIWGYVNNMDDKDQLKLILQVSALYVSRKYSYGDDKVPKLFKSKQKKELVKMFLEDFKKDRNIMLYDLYGKAKEYLYLIFQLNKNYNLDYKNIKSIDEYKTGRFNLVIKSSIEELKNRIPNNYVDCIITSPPYIYAQEYFRSTKIDLYWLNLINDEILKKLTEKEIGQKKSLVYDMNSTLLKIKSYEKALNIIEKSALGMNPAENIARFKAYFNDMFYFIKSSKNLLLRNGKLAIFIGEPKIFGQPIPAKDIFVEMMEYEGLKLIHELFDTIKSRHLQSGRLNLNPQGIQGEWLIIGEKL